jgi:hypothetical protein
VSTVGLTIDYSNGVQKQFSSIPWTEDLTILGAIEASTKIPPGAQIRFGSDRSGHALGLEIDEMPGSATPTLDWMVWVNERPFNDRLGTETSFGFRPEERITNRLKSGDQVLIKLSAKPQGT